METIHDKLCILDIETSFTDFKFKRNCKIAIAGVKVYQYDGNEYKPIIFKTFRNNELKSLELFLNLFDGLIIGYNIFEFDYAVLSYHIDLHSIIEKTVDILLILASRNKIGLAGLKLDSIAQYNLNLYKTEKGDNVADLWEVGDEQKVIEYNENDCYLTFRLWEHIILTGSISYIYKKQTVELELSAEDIKILKGENIQYTFKTWQEKRLSIEKKENLREYGENLGYGIPFRNIFEKEYFGQEVDFAVMIETEYLTPYCLTCDKTYLYENRIIRGFANYEMIKCIDCGTELFIARTDGSYRRITYYQGNITKHKSFKNVIEKEITSYINSTRNEWSLSPLFSETLDLGLANKEEHCAICCRFLHSILRFQNPLDSSINICADCLTALRWKI
jgi:hypothetical protein